MKNKSINQIKPMEFEEITSRLKDIKDETNYLELLKDEIDLLPKFAFAPYFWMVSTNNFTLLDCSNNLHELTPFEGNEWKDEDNFMQKIIPEEDLGYFYGANFFMTEFLKNIPSNERAHYKYSIYCRMRNTQNQLRWVVCQYPKIVFDANGNAICGIMVITDLEFFDITNKPRLTILNTLDKNRPYYSVTLEDKKVENLDIPKISNREKEVLSCVIKGMTSRQIAEKLFISYHTVENHKRNLREKTKTKTSGELVSYVLSNNLI